MTPGTLVLPEVRCHADEDDRFVEAATLVCDGGPGEVLLGYALLDAIGYHVPEGDVAAHARLRLELAIARGERRLHRRQHTGG